MNTRPGDPDVTGVSESRRSRSSPFAGRRPSRWRRFTAHLSVVLAVAAGGVLGGCARYGIEVLVPTGSGGFPWATFAANVAGSFLLALLLVLVLQIGAPWRYLRPFAAVGLLGSFTTFSTWMVEFDQLLIAGEPAVATGYLTASVLAGLAATSLGLVMGRGLATRRGHALAPNSSNSSDPSKGRS